MKGVWDEENADDSGGNKKGKKRKLTKRRKAFWEALLNNELNTALD